MGIWHSVVIAVLSRGANVYPHPQLRPIVVPRTLPQVSSRGLGAQGSQPPKCPVCKLHRPFVKLPFYTYDLGTVPEKAMALHSSTLAWKIPCMEEPGRLQSMGSLRVGHY